MPNIIIPRSNEDLIRFFETATRVATEDRLATLNYLDVDWTTQSSDFVEDFKTRVRASPPRNKTAPNKLKSAAPSSLN